MTRTVRIAVLSTMVVLLAAGPAAPARATTPSAVPIRGDWEIAPNVLLSYNSNLWRLDAAQNSLQSQVAPGCGLAANVGRGIPEGWKLRRVNLVRGKARLTRTTYYDARWRLQFAVYLFSQPTNLDYLNSEGVLLTPPNNVSRWWGYCRRAAEQVLATARRVGG
ncbi:MAG: hypothetical protein ACK4WM_07030 [Thermoflexales bacterium]